MAQVLGTFGSLEVLCPYCGKRTEVEDLEIACTASGVDCTVLDSESQNDTRCEVCGALFTVDAHCSIDVFKYGGGVGA
ncbi:MAG: hypothetical protein AUJ49_04865 [Desulfovibrionaceae bacterium CG1_02_65_16]|nr:MAG: hypothetical protein AUJ49_04865 [Desulfovibrionaceae bacterium CG1_02_65_16]